MRQTSCLTCYDVEWLVEMGESPESIASRMFPASRAKPVEGMRRHLHKCGRDDLLALTERKHNGEAVHRM